MIPSRTVSLIALLVILAAVSVALRILESNDIRQELQSTTTEPEISSENPAVEIPEVTAPDTTTPTTPSPVLPPPKETGCYVGGCSSQICSEQSGVVSTCEFREEYACYHTAVCKRQTTGECGWSETEELKSCLQKASSTQNSGV